MAFCKRYGALLLLLIFITGCKSKKKPSLSGEEPVEVSDFIEFFKPVSLPYQLTDSVWKKKENDSLLISYKVFTQFVPDSLFSKVFGKNTKVRIYPIGKVKGAAAETYLFAKVLGSDKKVIYVLGINKKQDYIAGLTLLPPGQSSLMQSIVMDRRYTITNSKIRRNKDGSQSEGKEVFALNQEAGEFQLIMTEALDDKATELINPIDTLPRKSKYAADYSNGKMNLVSIRDGRKTDRLSFFIHFEKNNGECIGELKGEALFRSPSVAEYKEAGDPCVLKFIFTNSSVSLKEVDGCGSRRGLRCSFDGSFAKKRDAKPKAIVKKKDK